jgi:hypothetical protein
MPFVLDFLVILSACTRDMFAWIRYSQDSKPEDKVTKLNIDLCDQQGQICVQIRGFVSRSLDGDKKSAPRATPKRLPEGTSDCKEDGSAFDGAFYQKLIADVANRQVSVDEALELG